MAEYIEREKAIEHIETHLPYRCSEDFIEGQKDCVEQLKSLPASDVVEVVHGEWEEAWEDAYRCSICHHAPMVNIDDRWLFTKYCPNCGAKMDGEKND